MPIPQDKHLRHLRKPWIDGIVKWLENTVRHHRIEIYITTVAIIIISMIGIYMIKVSGSLIEDMPKNKQFTQDIQFIEDEFDGVMALEFLIDTKRPKGVMKLSTLKRMERLDEIIDEIPELSRSVSILNIVKYTKQAFYNNNPEYYQLPTREEQVFIMPYVKNSANNENLLTTYIDSTGRYTRLTTFMKDIGTEKMERIEERINARVDKAFPKEKYEVTMTGKALVFLKGTNYLIKNLHLKRLANLLLGLKLKSRMNIPIQTTKDWLKFWIGIIRKVLKCLLRL